MSLGQFGDLALVTSFPIWVYNKSLAAKDILKEVVLGAGVFLRSNMAQGVTAIHEDSRTAPYPMVRKEELVRSQSAHPQVALPGFIPG